MRERFATIYQDRDNAALSITKGEKQGIIPAIAKYESPECGTLSVVEVG